MQIGRNNSRTAISMRRRKQKKKKRIEMSPFDDALAFKNFHTTRNEIFRIPTNSYYLIPVIKLIPLCGKISMGRIIEIHALDRQIP